MALDPNREDLVVGVIGTGAMGRGIMQVAAQGGMQVFAYDEKSGAAESAVQHIRQMLDGLVAKGRLDKAGADAAVTTDLTAWVSTTACISVSSATSSTTSAVRRSRGSLCSTSLSGLRSDEWLAWLCKN